MNVFNRTQLTGIIPILIFTILVSGCIFYRKDTVQSADLNSEKYPDISSYTEFIKQSLYENPLPILHTPDFTYDITLVERIDDRYKITVKKANYPFLFPSARTFRKNRIPELYRPVLLNSLNIFTSESFEEGEQMLDPAVIDSIKYYSPATAKNVVVNTLVIGGGTIGAMAIFLAIACNCPQVYTIDDQGNKVNEGAILTGAISQSLQKTDFLPLYGLNRDSETLSVTIANELPEDEYLDQISVLKAPRPHPGYQLGYQTDRQLFQFSQLEPPKAAATVAGEEILTSVRLQDDFSYGFDDLPRETELTSAVFSFPKSAFSGDQTRLIIYARQTEWLETVAEHFFQAFGNKFDQWNKMMDKVTPETYQERLSERGISLNVYIKTPAGWEKAGTFHDAGVTKKKYLGMDIDLRKIQGDEIAIRLESVYKFWEIDQIGLTETWEEIADFQPVSIKTAINEKGEDVSDKISETDRNYAVQPHAGSEIEITFANEADDEEMYFIRGTGYYHHIRDYKHEPNRKMIRYMRLHQKTVTQEMSVALDLASRMYSKQ